MSQEFKTSPISPEKLNELLKSYSREQLLWLNGYLSAYLYSGAEDAGAVSTATEAAIAAPKLTILYGTHTGHSENIAYNLGEKAQNAGIEIKVESLEDFKARQIKDEERVAIIVSTHGEGEPPLMAEDFHAFISGKRAPKLESLQYSVLALGDKSYKLFCQTGIDIDNALKKTGAKEILPIVTCDVDFEDNAEKWIDSLVEKISSSVQQALPAEKAKKSLEAPVAYNRKNPFYATILDKVRITADGSSKEVYHLELSLDESGIKYEPGDTLAVLGDNHPELVNSILKNQNWNSGETVNVRAGEISIEKALHNHLEISVLNRDLLQNYAEISGDKKLNSILKDEAKTEAYLFGYDLLDLLEEFPFGWQPQQLVDILRNLPPRLYSISSSLESSPEEVHITVALLNYERNGRNRYGAISSFLAGRIEIDQQIPVYIEKNSLFRLPKNPDAPVIMVGAGTGIAPYRAFLQDRESKNLLGNSWLIFGERNFYTDFLYQVEWQKFLKNGVLGKLDLAFSRDQEEKIYVQHKLLENQKEVYEWLQKGAHFYLCGDKTYMAKDVQEALVEIVRIQGGVTEEKAREYLKQLRKEKRFLEDVY